MNEIVKLDVGGHLYTTTRSTLTRYPDSMLGAMFSRRMPSARDPNGAYIIDGDGPIFRYVLSFLRRGKLNLPTDFKDWDMLKSEADFYQIQELVDKVTETTENMSIEFIEIQIEGADFTYIGNQKTLEQLPLLLNYLSFGSKEGCGALPPPEAVLNVVRRDGGFKLTRGGSYKRMTEVFQEILKHGFELKVLSSLNDGSWKELRYCDMDEIVKLDVGGHLYTTTRSTLTRYPDSMLGAMFSGRMPSTRDPNGIYFIDGDGPIFRYVLSFLRRGKLNLPKDFKDWSNLKSEADFYQIKGLQDIVTKMTEKSSLGYIEIVLSSCAITYIGSRDTLEQLPHLIKFLTEDVPYDRPKRTPQKILDAVNRRGFVSYVRRGEFIEQQVKIFQEILNLGFELRTSSSAFASDGNQDLRWTFTPKIY